MLKKVLSVVLALVLTLGVCVVAASAATTADLESMLTQLPSEYNARFYNDSTSALILEARAAATAAIESGVQADIDSAYALCEEAFDTAYYTEEQYIDAIEDYMDVYVNRDESKAHADYYYTTTADEYLQPGDTFDVTISIKTDFYVKIIYTGFAYDKTKFEFVEGSQKYGEGIEEWLDTENGPLNTAWGYSPSTGKELDGGFPDSWTDEMKSQYGLLEKIFIYNTKGTQFFYPTEETELVTFTMKVKDDVEKGTTGRIFVNNDLCATTENYTLGCYDYPLVEFTRAYGPNINDTYADLDGVQHKGYIVTDQYACAGQTITFHDADMTFNIDDEPVNLDYTALEAAIASKDGLNEADYTTDSWATFADAVAAGKTGKAAATTQEEIDALTAAIVEAREALEKFVQDSSILSITAKTTPVVGSYATLEVLVSKPASKIQFVNSAGGTATYYPGYDRVISVVNNDDGTQTWTIKMMVYKISETYQVFPKFGRVWDSKYYRYVLSDDHDYDSAIYSVNVPDAKDSRVTIGRHDIVVEAGLDVCKIQFAYLGTTATFTANNATIEEKDGHNYWTISFNFCKVQTAGTYEILSRAANTSFEKSDFTLVLDVLH